MSLIRVWTPSGNYSGGGTKRLIVLHTMEGFTGPNGAYDCAKYFQGNVGASSHVCIDNNRGKIWESVSRGNGSWTQCNYNSVSVSAEQSGYASWSSSYWLNERESELRNTADWIAEESKILSIPIVLLSDSQAQGSGRGVTFHSRLGSAGCGHSDPGNGYPINQVLEWAKGDSPVAPTEEADMATAIAIHNGKEYHAYIAPNGNVCVNGSPVDPNSFAVSGPGLAIDHDGHKVLSFVNRDHQVCTYNQDGDNTDWIWVNKRWSAK